MNYYNLCGIGSQHSNISKGKGGGCTKDKFKFGAKLISDNFYVSVPEWFLFLYFKHWYFSSLKRFWDCDFNFVNVLVCPIPVKTDVGQVDLVLRLSDGTSEKIRFPNVPVRRTNLFPFRSLKRFWDCDFNFVNVLELHQSME
jgi:hypothetical protein